ncbi:MAG: integration host factor subunit alpha [Alphaproteobacteria bacterium]|nr:integration host factor subunit alpha [Alphaproteobacteria bacterium]
MATITRADLAANIQKTAGLTGAESYKMVDLFFDEISEALIRGEEVKIANMGTFKILDKKERMGRNPKTGEPAVISARRVVSFRPSTEFRKKVANG